MEIQYEKSVGMIGVGYWGKNILRNLYELGVLHTACDIENRILDERQEQFPDLQGTTCYEDLLKNPGINAIAVATPAVTHYVLVKQALLAGKDVFVEKPLALTVKEGEELVHMAEQHNRILMVGHILQYHPAVIKLKELITSGELGKIQYIYSNRLNIGKLRTEENILWSFAPHDISVMLMLIDEEPTTVSAFGGDYVSANIYDTTLTTLEFKNGIKGHIFVSWLHPFKEQKLIVVGSKAMAVFDDISEEKLFLYPHSIEWKNGKVPVAKKADFQIVAVAKEEPLKEEMKHFIECVNRRKTPKTDGREGLRVLRIIRCTEKELVKSTESRTSPNPVAKKEQDYLVHEKAIVDDNVTIGQGTKIWHFTHILQNSNIGKNCVVGQNVFIGPEVTIGNHCKIQNNVSIYKGVTLENEVFCGPSCVFTNVYNPRAFIERKHEFRPTMVKRGATIGANATIVCGVTIGEYAMIGAGAVVKNDVPAHAIITGVPGRQTGWTCRCGTTLKFHHHEAHCQYCGNNYRLDNNVLLTIKQGKLFE